MGTVINLPAVDTTGLGRGLRQIFDALGKRKEEQRRKDRFQKVIQELLTTEQQNEAVLTPAEDIAEEEPTEAILEAAQGRAGTTRVPRTDEIPMNEILLSLGEFLQPNDLASLLLAPKRVPEQTLEEIRDTSKAKRGGALDAENEQIQILIRSSKEARDKGNNRRANTINKQVEKLTGKSLKTIEAEAEAKKSGDLTARRENIEGILGSLQRGDESPLATTTNLFSGLGRSSTDAAQAVNLFIQSRALTMAGESGLANSLITQANFLMNNSPEIRRQKELNKPISAVLAAELQVPVGTNLGDVSLLIPRSPEEVTEATSEASAMGKAIVRARQDLAFIGEARASIGGLLTKLDVDPGLVGIRGSLRAKGKTAIQVIDDLALNDFFGDATEIAANATGEDAGLIGRLISDPTLSVLELFENSVGMILAQIQTPTGRVPVEVIKRSIAMVKLRGLTSSGQVIDRLTFIDGLLANREANLRGQFNRLPDAPSEAPSTVLFPSVEDAQLPLWRFINGELVEVPR